jgi:hypothetical protein
MGLGIRQGLCNNGAGEAICLNEDLLLGLMYGVSYKLGSAAIGRKSCGDSPSGRSLKGLIVAFLWRIGEDRDHDAEAEYAERVLGEAFTVKMRFHHPVQGL